MEKTGKLLQPLLTDELLVMSATKFILDTVTGTSEDFQPGEYIWDALKRLSVFEDTASALLVQLEEDTSTSTSVELKTLAAGDNGQVKHPDSFLPRSENAGACISGKKGSRSSGI